jgi:hypothetical protein
MIRNASNYPPEYLSVRGNFSANNDLQDVGVLEES